MTREKRPDLRFPLFAVGTLVCALLLSLVAWQEAPHIVHTGQWLILCLLLGAILVSELLVVVLPTGSSGTISMSYPLAVATYVFFGAAYGVVAALVSVVPLFFAHERKS